MDQEIALRYLGVDYEKFIVCRWAIELSNGISGKEVVDVKKWTDDVVALQRYARVWLKRINPQEYPAKYELIISGRGPDERCRWCKTFRTALDTHMKKLNCSTQQHGSCEFE